jgi:hypothetical protein
MEESMSSLASESTSTAARRRWRARALTIAALTVAAAGAALSWAALARAPEKAPSSDLRARVEQLQRDVEAAPTTATTAPERAALLWEWTNAFARAGGVVPVNLTTIPAATARARAGDGPLPPGIPRELDQYVRELAVKEADPRAIGTLTLSPEGPLRTGSHATIEQTYTVGTKPLVEGAVVLVARQMTADQGTLQHRDPAAENYVSIRSSDAGARWEPRDVQLAGMHGGFRGAQPMPAFRLSGASLDEGETLTVTYGDRSGGSKGFRLQSFSTDQLLLPLYFDLDGSGLFLTPRWPGIAVEGGAVEAVSAIAPSVVSPGESFALRLRSEDRFWNRATGPKPAYRVLLDGKEVGSVPAAGASSEAALATVDGLELPGSAGQPRAYRFEVRSEDGEITTLSNPVWVREQPSPRIFWGETHGHTGMAEGQGSAGRFWTWARHDARLDFAGLSEHDLWLDDREWGEMQRLARESMREGDFLAFLGYEWTAQRAVGGHHNVFFRTPDRERVPVQTHPSLPELYRGLAESAPPEDTLVIPHAHQAADWTMNDGRLEKLVEIYSMHGSFEWFGNLYLKNGFQVGFVAASDDHRARPGRAHGYPQASLAQRGGLAAVLAPERTSRGVFDGLRELRSYATSGARILLDASLNGEPMGTRQRATDRRELRARVAGTAPIDHVDVVKNGEVVWSRHFLAAPLASKAAIQIGFESSSDVFGKRDNPRAYRVWEGTIEVEGASLKSVRPIGFDNLYNERAEIDAADPSTVRFRVETRGRRDTLLLDLEGVSASTAVVVHLDAAREYGASPTLVRAPVELPAAAVRLPFSALADGRVEHEIQVDDHTDRIRLQVVNPEGPFDQEVAFTDMDPPRPGDYYYLRVTQLDGERAWSSPFWVGERPPAGGR